MVIFGYGVPVGKWPTVALYISHFCFENLEYWLKYFPPGYRHFLKKLYIRRLLWKSWMIVVKS